MRPVSDALLSTIRGSHGMAARARVVTTYQEGTDPDGTEVQIDGGDVQLDASADIRSTVELVTLPALWPSNASDLLTPYGNELYLERSVRLGGGVVEWVSLGYFGITAADQDDAPLGAVRVAGQDRMAGIVRGRLTSPRQYAATTTYGTVVDDLVHDIYPAATIEWDDATSGRLLGRAVIAEEDRYAFLADLITSVGKIWYWDHRGVLVIKDPPDPAEPVFDVDAGPGGVLISLSRNLSREEVYNGVVAYGEAADDGDSARAVVVDGNPASPTRWGGPFGKVPRFYSSPLITTPAQAASAAGSLLLKSTGLPYNADFRAVPNPALEPYDPVRVSHPGETRTYVIDKLTVPLVADAPLQGTTREQTNVVFGLVG